MPNNDIIVDVKARLIGDTTELYKTIQDAKGKIERSTIKVPFSIDKNAIDFFNNKDIGIDEKIKKINEYTGSLQKLEKASISVSKASSLSSITSGIKGLSKEDKSSYIEKEYGKILTEYKGYKKDLSQMMRSKQDNTAQYKETQQLQNAAGVRLASMRLNKSTSSYVSSLENPIQGDLKDYITGKVEFANSQALVTKEALKNTQSLVSMMRDSTGEIKKQVAERRKNRDAAVEEAKANKESSDSIKEESKAITEKTKKVANFIPVNKKQEKKTKEEAKTQEKIQKNELNRVGAKKTKVNPNINEEVKNAAASLQDKDNVNLDVLKKAFNTGADAARTKGVDKEALKVLNAENDRFKKSFKTALNQANYSNKGKADSDIVVKSDKLVLEEKKKQRALENTTKTRKKAKAAANDYADAEEKSAKKAEKATKVKEKTSEISNKKNDDAAKKRQKTTKKQQKDQAKDTLKQSEEKQKRDAEIAKKLEQQEKEKNKASKGKTNKTNPSVDNDLIEKNKRLLAEAQEKEGYSSLSDEEKNKKAFEHADKVAKMQEKKRKEAEKQNLKNQSEEEKSQKSEEESDKKNSKNKEKFNQKRRNQRKASQESEDKKDSKEQAEEESKEKEKAKSKSKSKEKTRQDKKTEQKKQDKAEEKEASEEETKSKSKSSGNKGSSSKTFHEADEEETITKKKTQTAKMSSAQVDVTEQMLSKAVASSDKLKNSLGGIKVDVASNGLVKFTQTLEQSDGSVKNAVSTYQLAANSAGKFDTSVAELATNVQKSGLSIEGMNKNVKQTVDVLGSASQKDITGLTTQLDKLKDSKSFKISSNDLVDSKGFEKAKTEIDSIYKQIETAGANATKTQVAQWKQSFSANENIIKSLTSENNLRSSSKLGTLLDNVKIRKDNFSDLDKLEARLTSIAKKQANLQSGDSFKVTGFNSNTNTLSYSIERTNGDLENLQLVADKATQSVRQLSNIKLFDGSKDFKSLSSAIDEFTKSSNFQIDPNKLINTKGLTEAKNEIKAVQQEMAKVGTGASKDQLTDWQNRIEQATSSLKQLGDVSNQITNKKGTFTGDIVSKDTLNNAQSLRGELTRLASESLDASQSMSNIKYNDAFKTLSYDVTNADGTLTTFKLSADNVTGQVRSLETTTREAASGFEKFATSLQNRFMMLATYLATFVSAYTVIDQVKEGFTKMSDINSDLTTINMTMPVTSEELKQIGDSAIQMGQDLGQSASEVLDAMKIYANANETATSITQKAKSTVMLIKCFWRRYCHFCKSNSSLLLTSLTHMKGKEDEIVNTYELISSRLAIDFGQGITDMADAVERGGSLADQAGMKFATILQH
jgi:hypothetical protein